MGSSPVLCDPLQSGSGRSVSPGHMSSFLGQDPAGAASVSVCVSICTGERGRERERESQAILRPEAEEKETGGAHSAPGAATVGVDVCKSCEQEDSAWFQAAGVSRQAAAPQAAPGPRGPGTEPLC